MLKRAVIFFCLLVWLPALAYYPSASIKFNNIKLKRSSKEAYEDKFLEFLKEFPEVLTPEGKKYKVDQECAFSIDLDENGQYLMDTIKVEKMGTNINYNLKTIEFLRQNPIKMTKLEPDKPVVLEIKYFAF